MHILHCHPDLLHVALHSSASVQLPYTVPCSSPFSLLLRHSALLTNDPRGYSWQNQLIFLAPQESAGQTAALLIMNVKLQIARLHRLYWQLLLLLLNIAAVETKCKEQPPQSSGPRGLGRATHMAAKRRVRGLC